MDTFLNKSIKIMGKTILIAAVVATAVAVIAVTLNNQSLVKQGRLPEKSKK